MSQKVSYAGALWDIAARQGPFVDLVRTDDEGKYDARVMAANLVPNVGNAGFTWQENKEPPAPPLLEDAQRQARKVEVEARKLFAASALAADESWTTITEQEREKFRICARTSLRTA